MTVAAQAARQGGLPAADAARAALLERSGGSGAGPMQRALVEFKDAVGDDLNLARAMAALNTAIGETPAGDAKD